MPQQIDGFKVAVRHCCGCRRHCACSNVLKYTARLCLAGDGLCFRPWQLRCQHCAATECATVLGHSSCGLCRVHLAQAHRLTSAHSVQPTTILQVTRSAMRWF